MEFSGKHSKTIPFYIGLVLIYILALSSIFPQIRAIPQFNLLWTICIVSWFVVTVIDTPKFLYNSSVHRIIIYFYLLYTIIVPYLLGNGIIGNRFFELSQLPLFYIAYQHYKSIGRQKECFQLILLLLPFLLLTCYTTIQALLDNPLASRSVKKTEKGFEAMRQGIGSYELIYFLVLSTCILLFTVFPRNKRISRRHKLFGILLIIVCVVTIVLSNFMTALLLCLIAIMGRIVYNRINIIKLIFIPILFVLTITIAKNVIANQMDSIISLYGNTMNAKRLVELQLMLLENESGESIEARSGTFNESISLAIKNPIFGIIKNPIQEDGSGVKGFGQHSFILDTFALFGIFIGLVQVYIYAFPFVKRIRQPDGKLSSFALVFMFIFIILISINNASPSIGFAAFFIFPLTYDWLSNGQIKQKYV